jgi:hypothetical protein
MPGKIISRNLYGFLSQVISYQDSDLEPLYVFLRHLAAKLPRRKGWTPYPSMRRCSWDTTACRRSPGLDLPAGRRVAPLGVCTA